MASTGLVDSFNTSISTGFQTPYAEVHVLLVVWADNDLVAIDDEIRDLRSVFEKDYKYNSVSVFPIPINGSQQRCLNQEISSFVQNQSSRTDSLIVVFYAGHCSKSEQGLAEWAAYETGGPTLTWDVPQRLLFSAQGDVLLILDCCHASLITKGSKHDGGRFELIAASARGVRTPGPGRKSFTRRLIRLLKVHAERGITSEGLTSELREDDKITATPVFHDFVRKSPTRIRFQRLLQSPETPTFIQKPAGYLLFRASLSGDVTGLQIAEWLKTAPPENVTAVSIEAIISRARQMQQVLNDGAFPQGSIFEKLSAPARAEILRRLRNLNTVMANTADYAGSRHSNAPTGGQQEDEEDVIEKSFDEMQEALSTVCTAIETPLLLENGTTRGDGANLPLAAKEPEATNNKKADLPPNTLDDPFYRLMASADVQAALALRQAILDSDPCEYSTEIDHAKISFETPQRSSASKKPNPSRRRFRFGTFDGNPAIMEVYKYREGSPADNDKNTPSGERYPQTIQQLRKMTGLLCHPKRKAFHILPCAGFFRDRFRKELGLVFTLPLRRPLPHTVLIPPPGNGDNLQGSNGFVTLIELYTIHPLVPLGHRIHLAFALAMAVEHFHRVGWVHKTIRSVTIGFIHAPTVSPPPTTQEQDTLPVSRENTDGLPLLRPVSPKDANKPHSEKSPSPHPDITIDLSAPYLFGFEYARAGDGTTYLDEDHSLANNLYRHPDRWGKPSMRYDKSHDAYALGIVLLEIALWKDICAIARPCLVKLGMVGDGLGGGPAVPASDVTAALVQRCGKTLPHQVGKVFTGVILTCFDFGERTRGMSEYEGQMYFQKEVVEPLGRAVGRV